MFFLQFAQDLLKVDTGLSHPYMPALNLSKLITVWFLWGNSSDSHTPGFWLGFGWTHPLMKR